MYAYRSIYNSKHLEKCVKYFVGILLLFLIKVRYGIIVLKNYIVFRKFLIIKLISIGFKNKALSLLFSLHNDNVVTFLQ